MSRSRRAVLLAGAAAVLGGCAQHSPGRAGRDSSAPMPDPSAPTARPTSSESLAGLPAVESWTPSPGDLVPACKLAAARHVERLGNGRDTAIQVIEAQYGGLLPDAASVLVVTRSWRRAGSRLLTGGHTFDVRLTRSGQAWRVIAVNPSAPGAAARYPSSAARRVLRSQRITLPPAAAADVASGRVHDSTLVALLTVARQHRPTISVIRSGHPLYVFGTDRLSDHPQGRAFDTWTIDGHPVVDPRTPRSLIEDYMHAVASAGSYNVGGPFLLGSAPQWFSDDTHHDHVHAGFAT